MITDNTAKWNVKKITDFGSTPGIPIGFTFFTMNKNVPEGFLPLLGGEFNRDLYQSFWSWVQEQPNMLITEAEWQEKFIQNNGNVQFYSTGNGTDTFRVPVFNGWIKTAGNIDEVGTHLKAGLPNITGKFIGGKTDLSGINEDYGAGTGAVVRDSTTQGIGSSSNGPQANFSFNASRSSSIYGASDTVQPESIVGMWIVKASGSITNIENQDLAEISNAFSKVVTVKVWD